GESVELGEYLQRFPKFATELRAQFAVDKAIAAGPLTWAPDDASALASTVTDSSETRGASIDQRAAVPGYEIMGVLGRGGMGGGWGVVYKARHIPLKRVVALKMIKAGVLAEAEEVIRFRREAEAAARLQHANIVQILEIGEHAGQPYLALEYVEGGSLAQTLVGTPQPARLAAELVETLARTMHYAHQRGIVHRDLKPANILLHRAEDGLPLDKSGSAPTQSDHPKSAICNLQSAIPKITDFGLAKLLDLDESHTHTGAILGTPGYMAPEQAHGRVRDLGPATDVYALGAILYELLTGRPPFAAASVLETLEQVRTLEPVRPTALQPRLPGDLETICLKCLSKEPAERYASARDLAADLRRFLDGDDINARRPTWLEGLLRSIGYRSTAPAHLQSWSFWMLLASPVPVLVQLLVLVFFGGQTTYPVLALSLAILSAGSVVALVLWPLHQRLLRAPRAYRRFIWSLVLVRCTGLLMAPALVAIMRPGDTLDEFHMVFVWWIFLEG